MPNSIHDRALRLFPAIEGAQRSVTGEAASEEGSYVIVLERSEEEGGEFLVFVPRTGDATVLMADTTVRPVDSRLVPEEVRQALNLREGEEAGAEILPDREDLEALFEPIRRAFERVRRPEVDADRGPRPPQPGSVNDRIHQGALRHEGNLSSRNVPGTDHGNLACAWAVNYVVRDAIGRPVGGGLSTANMYEALVDGRGTQIGQDGATPGSIIISPRRGSVAGHVGIVGAGGRVYSNSSARALWVQNYTFSSWRRRYVEIKRLGMHFFNVNP